MAVTVPPLPPGLATRPVAADDLENFFRILVRAFGEDSKPEFLEVELLTAEADRAVAIHDGDDLVATAGAFTFDLALPGGRLPTAGVTYVSVAPTHRRRGVLTAMMASQLADIHERGEPLAILWASEAAIYGRFGYGLASQLLRIEVDRVDARLRSDLPATDDVHLRLVEPDTAVDAIVELERRIANDRPGVFTRDERWIKALVADPVSGRSGMSGLRGLLADVDGRVAGYALYRTKPGQVRPHMLPDGEVFVTAQRAATPVVDVALTRTLMSVDLMRRVRWWNEPVDSTVPHLLVDARHARTTVLDALHLRVIDVAAALSGRRYAAPVDVVIEVRDELCPWNDGRWHLVGDVDGAECRRTDATPVISLSVESLGAAYLGGTSLASLIATGRVTSTDEKVAASVATAFGWPVAPWCPVIF